MMNIKKLALVSIVGILSLTGTAALAQGNSNANPMSVTINGSGQAQITGVVTAVSGNTVSISSWGGTWAVNTTNATFGPETSNLAAIKVGDTVKISGTVTSGMNINATKVTNKSMKTLTGTISNLNIAAGTFTLATQKNGNVTVSTNSATQITVNGNTATLAGLANGVKVNVVASYNANTNTATATFIKAPAVEKNTVSWNGWEGWWKSFKNGNIFAKFSHR